MDRTAWAKVGSWTYWRPVIDQSDCESLICSQAPFRPSELLLVYLLKYFQVIFLLRNSYNQKHIISRSGPLPPLASASVQIHACRAEWSTLTLTLFAQFLP